MKEFLNNPYEEDISHSDDELNNIIEDDWEILVADAQLQFQLEPAMPLPTRRFRVVVRNDSDDEVMGDGINIDLNAFYDNDFAEDPAPDAATAGEAGSRRVGLLPSSPSPEPDTINTDSGDSAPDTDSQDHTQDTDAFSPFWIQPAEPENNAWRLYDVPVDPDVPVNRETEATSVEDVHSTRRDDTS